MQYQIYWTPETELLELQGAIVDFKAIDQVYYENKWLPSGQVVARWSSKRRYEVTQKLADLPILARGQFYELERHITNSDKMFGLLSLTFYDRYQRRLKVYSQDKDSLAFEVPDDYDYYEVELVTAGAEYIVFHDFVIRPQIENGRLIADDEYQAFETGEQLHLFFQEPKVISSSTLRVIFSEPNRNTVAFPIKALKKTNQGVLFIADGRPFGGFFRNQVLASEYEAVMIQQIESARAAVKATTIELVGYGPISSYAAVYYIHQIAHGVVHARISNDVLTSPAAWIEQQPMTRLTQAVKVQTRQLSPIIIDESEVVRFLASDADAYREKMPYLYNSTTTLLNLLPYEAEPTPTDAQDDAPDIDAKRGLWQRLFKKNH
jgi:accessory secretory protein Asp3